MKSNHGYVQMRILPQLEVTWSHFLKEKKMTVKNLWQFLSLEVFLSYTSQ